MKERELHDRITELLPSPDLKTAVENTEHVFSPEELLKMICEYSPTYDERQKLLAEAAETFSDKKAARHAARITENDKKVFDAFMAPYADAVYELDIKCDPWDEEEKYSVKTFDDALITIRAFLKYYKNAGAHDVEHSRYIITKKSCAAPAKPSDISKLGFIGDCELIEGLKIKSVYMSDMNEYRCGALSCVDCKRRCVRGTAVHYPKFLEKYDLVAYRSGVYKKIDGGDSFSEYSDTVYGILTYDMAEEDRDYDSYVVLLDSPAIKERRAEVCGANGYYEVFSAHSHPEYAEIFKPNKADVPDGVYADYLYAVDALKKIEESDQ